MSCIMKLTGAYLLSALLIFGLIGCADMQSNQRLPESSSQSDLTSDASGKEENTFSNSNIDEISSSTASSRTKIKYTTPPEYKQYLNYVEPFIYDMGYKSWDDPMQLDPDALAVYYISLEGIGEIKIPRDGPRDKEFENPLMPAEDVEQAVQKHFDVTSDHMRKSQYYDPETNCYWSGGIGSTAEAYVVGAEQTDDLLTIEFKIQIVSSDYNAAWDCNTVIQLEKDNYQYLSYEKNLIYEYELFSNKIHRKIRKSIINGIKIIHL